MAESFRIAIVAGLAALGGSAAPAIVSKIIPSADQDRALKIELLKVSLDVLSNDVHQYNYAIREWAVDTINSVAAVKVEGEARNSLIDGSLPLTIWKTSPPSPLSPEIQELFDQFKRESARTQPAAELPADRERTEEP